VCPLRYGLLVSSAAMCLEDQLVSAGLGRWNEIDDPGNKNLKRLEGEARVNHRGIWKGNEAIGATHPFTIKAEWKSCKADVDCVALPFQWTCSWECINRAHLR